jgi:hypothetical protein
MKFLIPGTPENTRDYDDDRKGEATVFRPSNSTWFTQGSTSGTIIQQFGSTGDVPVLSEFVR